MNDCERLSDRMPEVSLGRSSWTAEEAAHLEGCADCGAEWRLVRAAAALDWGASVIPDPAAIAAAVQRRLAEAGGRSRRLRIVWLTGAAAAATLLAVVARWEPGSGSGTAAVVADADPILPLPELEGLETGQLDTLLHSIDRPFAGSSTLDAATLGEHEEGELEQMLATWEG
jgi:hypothetical protein